MFIRGYVWIFVPDRIQVELGCDFRPDARRGDDDMLPRVARPAAAATAGTTGDASDKAPLLSTKRGKSGTDDSAASWLRGDGTTAENGEDWDDWATAGKSLMLTGGGVMPGISPLSATGLLDVLDDREGGERGIHPLQTSPLNNNDMSVLQPSKQQQQRQRRQQQLQIKSGNRRPRPKEKRKRRPRKRTEAENDLFTSFTLNRDPQTSKYLPYDEIVYPKLFNRPQEARRGQPTLPTTGLQPVPAGPRLGGGASLGAVAAPAGDGKRDAAMVAAAELDSMWVVGFVEDARRHQKDMLLRDLRDFVRLPGSTVLPGAHAALAAISLMGQPTSFNSTPPPDSKAKAVSSSSAAAEGHDRHGAGGGDDDSGDLYGSAAAKFRPSAGKIALTDLECLRLRELEKRLSQESLGVQDADVRHHAGVQAYGAANRKLRKILGGARPPFMGPAIKSDGLEAVFQRNREVRAAATRIQRLYKHYYRRKRFRQMTLQLQGVVKIQALARGVLARRFVAEWYARRSVMVLAWQNIIRRMLSNIRWRRRLALEQGAASKIQAAARARAGRQRARATKVNLAALRIQCLWRGSVDRARVDRLWLGALATRIQGLVRVMVAKRVVGRTRRIRNGAARSIQRNFRGTVARKVMVGLIWARSMERRRDFLRVLAAEEEWERENMEIKQRRSRRMMLEEKLEAAVEAEAAAHAAVFELEVRLVLLQRWSGQWGKDD